ncbi:MAG TPA: thymidine phosphorylase [Verrucomicrobiae bacterium]|jgi:pyrimidine-nucleoside phosphorylase|nr:thymidine phosphorylase [Verrucomicrobiae bacterium]
MRPLDLVRKKRDGGEHSPEEISSLVDVFTRGAVPDYQMAAWLMAVFLRGMSDAETAALTDAMMRSGRVLDLTAMPGVKVDKHSTGGVGDKTSLILAPIVAAGGLKVPMISGRGLGHTGGTLDKLEAIAGFNVNLQLDRFFEVLGQAGCALIGQTAEIVPADKKMYALRDVTATVESSALICASIMSKKLAEGIDALVLDVKTGSGAFMKRPEDAEHLAQMMVQTGHRMGKKMVALITDMDQPLGRAVGNSLEVLECLEILRGERRPMSEDLRTLSLDLSGWMFFLGGRAASVGDGLELAGQLLANGKALAKFHEICRLQGAPDPSRLPAAKFTVSFPAPSAGFIESVQCEQVGLASLVLGGGRNKHDDVIDHAVGLELHKKTGDPVKNGEPIATVHYNDPARLPDSLRRLAEAYVIGNAPPATPQVLIKKIISPCNNLQAS